MTTKMNDTTVNKTQSIIAKKNDTTVNKTQSMITKKNDSTVNKTQSVIAKKNDTTVNKTQSVIAKKNDTVVNKSQSIIAKKSDTVVNKPQSEYVISVNVKSTEPVPSPSTSKLAVQKKKEAPKKPAAPAKALSKKLTPLRTEITSQLKFPAAKFET